MDVQDHERWRNRVGRPCRLTPLDADAGDAAASIAWRVVEVSDPKRLDGQVTYSILFESDDAHGCDQRTYDVTVDGSDAAEPLFLVPISATRLEAVVNRLVAEEAHDHDHDEVPA